MPASSRLLGTEGRATIQNNNTCDNGNILLPSCIANMTLVCNSGVFLLMCLSCQVLTEMLEFKNWSVYICYLIVLSLKVTTIYFNAFMCNVSYISYQLPNIHYCPNSLPKEQSYLMLNKFVVKRLQLL